MSNESTGCRVSQMIDDFEWMFYPLSDVMKEKLLASDPVASEMKIKDLCYVHY